MSFGAIGGGGGGGGGGGNGLVADAINDGTTTVAPSQNAVFDALAVKAPLASPTFTGTPAAPTATQGTNTTQVATTAYVQTEAGLLVPKSTVTTKGDLIVGTGAGAVTRRGVGTNGQVLTADSAQADGVKWASPSGIADPGGSNDDILQRKAGAWTYRTPTQLAADLGLWTVISEQTLGSAVASVTFSSLSAYKQFRLTVEGLSTGTGALYSLLLRPNNDTTATAYAFTLQGWYNTNTDSNAGNNATSSITLGYFGGSNATDTRGFVSAEIMQKTGGYATTISDYAFSLTSSSPAPSYGGRGNGTWKSATAISSLVLLLSSGNFATGTYLRLEGRA